jgi:hypothetical protein
LSFNRRIKDANSSALSKLSCNTGKIADMSILICTKITNDSHQNTLTAYLCLPRIPDFECETEFVLFLANLLFASTVVSKTL